MLFMFFFFNDTATTEIYTLSLHDALPIWRHDAALDSFGVGRAEHDPMPDHPERCPYHPGCADDLRSAFDGPSPGHGGDDRLPLTNGSCRAARITFATRTPRHPNNKRAPAAGERRGISNASTAASATMPRIASASHPSSTNNPANWRRTRINALIATPPCRHGA